MLKRLVLSLGLLWLFAMSVQADDRWSPMDGLEDVVNMQESLMSAQYDLMNLWIQCELDHLCVCEKKPELFLSTTNLVLQVMIERDKVKDQKRCQLLEEHYAQLCRTPEITQVNRALVPCYQQIQQGQFLNDKMLYNEGQVCMAERLQPFVNEKNPYAVYVYVDFLSANPERYPGLLQHYQQQWKLLQDTPQYQEYAQCMRLLSE